MKTHIDEQRLAEVTILRPIGRLEADEGDDTLRDRLDGLIREGRVNVVLDLGRVTRLDSAAMGILVSKYLTTRRLGGRLKLTSPTEYTAHLLGITRLSTVFEVFDDVDEAVRSFDSHPT